MSKLEYFVVDAFTTTTFKGNGAAVVLLEQSSRHPDTTLQLIAAEFNLAETAFLTAIDPAHGRFSLRWFTPTVEFPLCGHATLATAAVLFSAHVLGQLPETVKEVIFDTLSGLLVARVLPDSRIELELPAGEATVLQSKVEVEQVVRGAFHGQAQLRLTFVGKGEGVSFGKYLLVEIDGINLEESVVDSGRLRDLCPRYELIIFTQRCHDGSSTFASRVFCPQEAIPEDPVTGSAHCMLGPYWAIRLELQGSQEMLGKQLSSRSGVVGVIWEREKGTCRLQGHAKIFAKGELYLPGWVMVVPPCTYEEHVVYIRYPTGGDGSHTPGGSREQSGAAS